MVSNTSSGMNSSAFGFYNKATADLGWTMGTAVTVGDGSFISNNPLLGSFNSSVGEGSGAIGLTTIAHFPATSPKVTGTECVRAS